MAKNWNIAEAVAELTKGNDKEALQDMGRRFPLTLVAMTKMVAKAPEEFTEFANAIPDYITLRKTEKAFKEGVSVNMDEEEDEEEPEEKPAKKKAVKKTVKKEEPEEDEGEFAGMTAMDLYKECKKRGIKAAPKKTAKFYIELLENEDGDEEPEEKPAKKKVAKKKAPEPVVEDDDDDEWDI